MLSRHGSPRLVDRTPTDRFLTDMCRYYATKNQPAYTRLCHRYRQLRGTHVPGRYACGQYPKPARSNTIPTKRPPALCACGAPAASSDGKCHDCYIFDQIVDMTEEARQFVDPKLLQRAHQHIAARERQAIVHQAQKPAPN